jgi:hypothetical protein
MRFKSSKGIQLPLGISVDGWEVLLGGGIACIAVGAAEKMRLLEWIGIGIIVLWVIAVFLVNLGIIGSTSKAKAEEGGGSSKPASPGTAD